MSSDTKRGGYDPAEQLATRLTRESSAVSSNTDIHLLSRDNDSTSDYTTPPQLYPPLSEYMWFWRRGQGYYLVHKSLMRSEVRV
jgi:hypothetical protein